jgi:2-keto-4-pentenoate hydratase/2-oxohepta-3-ene-1,7-dioic acid hydratase in catechol pathway
VSEKNEQLQGHDRLIVYSLGYALAIDCTARNLQVTKKKEREKGYKP